MQGKEGEKGPRGDDGLTGERGVHFHVLYLNECSDDPSDENTVTPDSFDAAEFLRDLAGVLYWIGEICQDYQ